MTVADRIKIQREKIGLSQEDLAIKMGLKSRSSITRIEKSGDDVSMKDVERIAKYLDCSKWDLLGVREANNENIQIQNPVQNSTSIGQRIKYCRELMGMSQEELAIKMGYKDRSSISKIEKEGDTNISIDTIQKIAEELYCSPLLLTGWGNNDKCYSNKIKEISQLIFENQELRLLFDLAKDVSDDDIKTICTVLIALKKKEKSN